ncbi:site-specific integrase [Dysgonomonas sp.]|uniref:tyrosine-type recombinase/integrase n=1 Tax=Dysgonomonas sp. TaxID=1891233 RepID=UPI0027B8BDF9|nr:site-specific integrase [Dysgonomonas sp.]
MKSGLTRTLDIKSSDIIDECNILIKSYREITDKIENIDSLNIHDIIEIIKAKTEIGNSVDFIIFFQKFIRKLELEKSPSIQIYKATYNHLIKFNKSDILDVNKVTPKYLTEFEQYLSKENIGSRGQNLYLSRIRSVFNIIIDEYEHLGYTFSYPFRKYKLPKVKTPQTIALTKEQLNSIISVDLKGKVRAERSRDIFLISLFSLGTNATDLYDLEASNKGRLEYNRNKTKSKRYDNAFISINIEPELKPLLEKYKGIDPFLFSFRDMFANKPRFNRAIREGLRQVAEIIGMPYFDFYDARRTMASIMRNKLRISKDDVSMCLNHVDMAHKTTDFYIETDFSILDECNRKFLDYLFDKGDYSHKKVIDDMKKLF